MWWWQGGGEEGGGMAAQGALPLGLGHPTPGGSPLVQLQQGAGIRAWVGWEVRTLEPHLLAPLARKVKGGKGVAGRIRAREGVEGGGVGVEGATVGEVGVALSLTS